MTSPPDLSNVVQIPDDRRGWLALRGLPDELRRAEDSTGENDMYGPRRVGAWPATGSPEAWAAERTHTHKYAKFTRDATPTEKLLLAHLGYEVPDDLQTRVEFISRTVRRRTWPQLEDQEPNP